VNCNGINVCDGFQWLTLVSNDFLVILPKIMLLIKPITKCKLSLMTMNHVEKPYKRRVQFHTFADFFHLEKILLVQAVKTYG